MTTSRFQLETQGQEDIVDITERVEEAVTAAGVVEGTVVVFALHTTTGLTIIENEPGLLDDFREAWRGLIPREMQYRHNRFDDNGHSHVRASMLGLSLAVPVSKGRLLLGTWQRIVLVEFDTRPRIRQVVLQVVGE